MKTQNDLNQDFSEFEKTQNIAHEIDYPKIYSELHSADTPNFQNENVENSNCLTILLDNPIGYNKSDNCASGEFENKSLRNFADSFDQKSFLNSSSLARFKKQTDLPEDKKWKNLPS